MSIYEQAEVACNEWCAWVLKEGDAYWRYGDIPGAAIEEWIPGYLRGVQDRLSNVHGDDADHERLWNFGEDLSLLKQTNPLSEMTAKCYAAGYVTGYRSIGGGNG